MPTFALNGQPMAYGDFVTGAGDDAVTHPAINLILMSDADLAAIGVVRTPDPGPATFQESISRWQLRTQLRSMARTDAGAGTLLDQVNTLVAGSADADLQGYWDDLGAFERHHPKTIAMVTALGLTSDQADAAWIAAAQLR